ncbi:YusG family protein [Pseudalkalibacillus hwajinpoensis]|uniref:YusG family protein n=1 Tax=Guptibacillus hwajinpoensis TaxID=208199 RepID=UPI001CFE7FEA|nr:YusG family protein [Pseudalkalibacillus hwajinpoensis]
MIDTSRPMVRIDITNKVYGKFDQKAMNLFLNKEKIGRILFSDQGNRYELSEGYEFVQDKIYHYEQALEQNAKYVEDCDLGWC